MALGIPIAFCAITFHFQLYAELTPIGKYFGWAFLIQIFFVLIWGFVTNPQKTIRPTVHTITGAAIALFGLVGYPILTQLGERKWQGAEYFGIAPDPTICFFLGIALLSARPVWFLLLLPIPLLWTIATWGTLDVLDADFAYTLPVIATVTVSVAVWKAISLHYAPSPDS